ncbi:hypothetical protein JYU20_00385 [Bacteroidales bacterium AH-315-I05]|nr:hypothetical protein [Bacteroidales bacterium AH-315-I05]
MTTTTAIQPLTRPILFSTEMVKAILEGRKIQTRRIVKNQSINDKDGFDVLLSNKCPYGQPGDILWVRETFSKNQTGKHFMYKADIPLLANGIKWRPSIFMPKTAARLWLRITNIRVERLQDISQIDAYTEGVYYAKSSIGNCYRDYRTGGCNIMTTAKDSFRTLWYKIHDEENWKSNPWVWAIGFEQCEKPTKP